MQKFMLNITASSGEFYQGDCESLTLPTGDGVYGVQAGHNPVLVALHMGIAKFTVDGETVTTIIDVVAPGAAGVDYVWLSGVLLFALMLFCLFKLLGGIIS